MRQWLTLAVLLTCAPLASAEPPTAAAAQAGPAAPAAGRALGPVPDFGLLDHEGRFHQLRRQAHERVVVLFVHGNGCPIVRKSLPALRAVRAAQAEGDVVFWLLNANPQDDRDAVAREAADYGIDMPILLDEAQVVARALGITRTAEAIVISTEDWRVVYRGPIDDRLHYQTERPARAHYLRDALAALRAGRAVEAPIRPAAGCLIQLDADGSAAAGAAPSYARDVAPVLEARCRSCHRPEGVAPWSMDDYAMVRGWSAMMGEVLRTGRMPPWQADPHYGRFANDLGLPAAERALLVRWVEAGAPRGDGPDPLAQHPAPAAGGWALGEPDLVVAAPAQRIPASGVVPYRYVTVEVPLDREVWVRGVDVQPSNVAAMHHAIGWIEYPEGEAPPNLIGPRFTRGMFAGYVPGRRPWAFPEGAGYRLPAGSQVRLQLHYNATGRPETDVPRLALYLSEAPLAHELRVGAVDDYDFAIPPGASEHEVVATRRIPRDVVLYTVSPHMHYRGKRMRIEAEHPDGRRETLVSVPRYDFNWQHRYVLDPPLRLRAGTRLTARAAFDNSAHNPANPDPEAWVHWGEQSFDEMMFGYFTYRVVEETRTAGTP